MESRGQKPLPGNGVIMVKDQGERELDPQRLTGKLFIDVEGTNRVSGFEGKLPIFSI